MPGPWTPRFGIALLVGMLPVQVGAQQTCQQVLPSDFRRVITAAGQEIFYFRDPVRMVCTGGVVLEADSAVMNRSASTLEMVGQVLYRDGEQQLTADWANYLGATEDLFARGSVVLTNLADGSVMTGETFEYRRPTETRPEARMIMTGGRPHARIEPTDPEAEDALPLLVWARRLEMEGEDVFVARLDVDFERGDMRGHADMVRFDQAAGRTVLTGAAHVETDEYRLEGNRIDADMQGDTLREVRAEQNGRLITEELTLLGDRIRIGFQEGQAERVEAWNPLAVARRDTAADGDEDAPTQPVPRRAVAISADFQLRADSIDARSEEGRLREVRAVGRAYGEREADSLSVHLPDAVARDWIQGDTITGYFVYEPPDLDGEAATTDFASDEEPAGRTVLERIEVIGGSSHALSLYRSEASDGGGPPSVNFMRATRITLFMADGEVSRVEADGPIEGLHLDPASPQRPESPEPPTAPDARIAS
jgi:lipopolysaccharide export system protein LptA